MNTGENSHTTHVGSALSSLSSCVAMINRKSAIIKSARSVSVKPRDIVAGIVPKDSSISQRFAEWRYNQKVQNLNGGRGNRTPIAQHDLRLIRPPVAPARRPPLSYQNHIFPKSSGRSGLPFSNSRSPKVLGAGRVKICLSRT